VQEMTVLAEQYDFAVSLLLLEDDRPFVSFESEDEQDIFDRISPQSARREW
jgi:hypothetical protein